jgi:replicative DNA helicase
VGKSVLMVNNAISSLKSGKDVLFITFEMDVFKTALRAIGTATGININHIAEHQELIRRVLGTLKHTTKKRLLIHEMSPDECSVNHIYALLDNLRRREGWRPQVIILDYMDLMVSRHASYNDKDYTRQKHVANEIRGLAKNENVLVFTATQTNRSGAGEGLADLSQAAESFAKQFSLDYVVSLNQTQQQRLMNPPVLVFFIAKNRNGPKHETIQCEINYETMTVKER